MSAELAQVNGWPALILRLDKELDSVVAMRVEDGLVCGIYTVRNPEKLSRILREAAGRSFGRTGPPLQPAASRWPSLGRSRLALVAECLAEPGRVGENIDFDDLAPDDAEGDDGERSTSRDHKKSGRPVHHHRLRELTTRCEGQRLPRHSRRAEDHPRCASRLRANICPEGHVWVENRKECVEIAIPGGS
jgi:hypothetical protein